MRPVLQPVANIVAVLPSPRVIPAIALANALLLPADPLNRSIACGVLPALVTIRPIACVGVVRRTGSGAHKDCDCHCRRSA